MTSSTQIRDQLVRILRRDIIGPAPQDEDLATKLLAARMTRAPASPQSGRLAAGRVRLWAF